MIRGLSPEEREALIGAAAEAEETIGPDALEQATLAKHVCKDYEREISHYFEGPYKYTTFRCSLCGKKSQEAY